MSIETVCLYVREAAFAVWIFAGIPAAFVLLSYWLTRIGQ